MPTYRLGSSTLVHAPGIVAWAINGYAFERDRTNLLHVIVATWSGVRADHAAMLLSGAVPHTIEGETVIFSVPDDPGQPAPAPAARRTQP